MTNNKKPPGESKEDKSSTQQQIITDALIRDIVEWKIPPGTWIRERAIAERFAVSHAPVREAFRQLTNIGLIEVEAWRGARVIDIDRHQTVEVLELWKAMFGVVCRLACDAMSAADGRELLVRLEAYKDIVQRTQNTFEHLDVSNRIGSFIAWRCDAPLAKELLDRVALLARWQHHVLSDTFIEELPVSPGLRSAEIYEELCHHIVKRRGDEADRAARDLIGHLQNHFGVALDRYLSEETTRREAARRKPNTRKPRARKAAPD